MEAKKCFYNPADFSWTEKLEANWKIIRHELDAIINEPANAKPQNNWFAAHPHYVKNIKFENAWKTFDFLFFGIKHRHNSMRCPETVSLLNAIPELVSAEFSVMEPHTHILPHKGYSRMVLRCHLGLIIPDKTNCAIRVGNITKNWEEGKLIIFDDSFEHEAWNKSEYKRAVLMFDVAHPGMQYSAEQICRYKLERADDPFLLNIAPKETWLNWFHQGFFPEMS